MPGLEQDAIDENVRVMQELEEKLGRNYINKKKNIRLFTRL